MKILMITPTNARGGAEEYLLTIAAGALKEGWEVHTAFPDMETTASLVSDVLKRGITYHPLKICDFRIEPIITSLTQLSILFRILLFLRKVKPDLVMISLPGITRGFTPILACGLLKIPTIVVFHLLPEGFKFRTYVLKIYAWARSRGQRYIAISRHNRQLTAEYFGIHPDDILLIFNGVSSGFSPATEEQKAVARQRIRKELGIGKDKKIILSVGRVHKQKGYDYLVPIIPDIISAFPDTFFVWAGQDESEGHMGQLIKEYNVDKNMIILGNRKDIKDLLYASDMFVFPSIFEGLPFSLIEALMAGLPAVTTDACGISEVVTNKKHAVVCRKQDSASLREAMLYALNHQEEMKDMSVEAQKHVSKDFSEEHMVRKYMQLMRSLIETF
jgi:glycosyltransferase involved in cell wall biosynthesis